MKHKVCQVGADQWLDAKATCGFKSPLVGFAQQLQTTQPDKMGDFNPQVDSQAKLSLLLKCEGPRWLIG